MASRIKTFSRLQLSLKSKGSVTQLHNVKEYTNTFEVQYILRKNEKNEPTFILFALNCMCFLFLVDCMFLFPVI
ncbi:uncharacterized protein LACBIDRAFT_307449 [Laccaria bicolor S238N-H82]|uniref:Predicted protein n=1 Tax=Laccaria bicolor (strain S238N-H82 / ATCC MYA-4686) TaxID=486041 RepID=B0DQ62_LACBS|nr:uncharacterized protein LACBIDRAFT_307449 [Laccaria bicolor S238N-H82]EDR03237.1 predicted protein [Laccaria bicolor S238N-H82]|eukprot:XP_001886033.1 predicted protein [Laccaria bicolor S238N-H82]